MLLLFALLAPWAVIASETPRVFAWPLAIAAAAHGARSAWREARQPARALLIGSEAGASAVDGHPVHDLDVRWRGPLAFLRWRDQNRRIGRLVFWPDTLPATRRRELRLAAPGPEAARSPASMAP